MKTINFNFEKVYIQDQVCFGDVKRWVIENCKGIVKYGIDNEQLYAIFEDKKEATKFSLLWSSPQL